MKKLSLSVEDLKVDSFSTVASGEGRGTVRAHDATVYCTPDCTVETCDQYSCGADTFYCPVTGMETCGDTMCTCSNMPETCGHGCFSYYPESCGRGNVGA